jgi:hypothetical protein
MTALSINFGNRFGWIVIATHRLRSKDLIGIILQETLWAFGSVRKGAKNIPPAGSSNPAPPSLSEILYRLRHSCRLTIQYPPIILPFEASALG